MISQGNNDKGDIHSQIQKFLNGQTPEQAGLSPREDEIAGRLNAPATEQGNINSELTAQGKSIARLANNLTRDMESVRTENMRLHTLLSQLMHRIGQLEEQRKAERFMVDAVEEMPVGGFWQRLKARLWG